MKGQTRKRVLLAVIVFAVLITGLEILVRLLGTAPSISTEYEFFVSDPLLPYRLRPHEHSRGRSQYDEFDYDHKHNRFGLRDDEHEWEKPEGTFRILGLGDSFTYGSGAKYEETYLCRLERMLNRARKNGPVVEVIKAGIPRYFPEPERMFLEHYGVRFEPDLIVVGFIANDVTDTHLGLEAVALDEKGFLKSKEAAALGRAGVFLYTHSHLARTLLREYLESTSIQGKVVWREAYKANGLYEKAWKEVEAEFTKMASIADSIDARLAIVHIPIGPSNAQALGVSNKMAYPAARLAAWCGKMDALFIDTLPAMAKAAKQKRLYWTKDSHCNGDGYEVIAQTLFQALNPFIPITE